MIHPLNLKTARFAKGPIMSAYRYSRSKMTNFTSWVMFLILVVLVAITPLSVPVEAEAPSLVYLPKPSVVLQPSPAPSMAVEPVKYVSCGNDDSICPLQRTIEQNPGNLTIILASNVTLTSPLRVTDGRVITIWGALNIEYSPQISAQSTRLFTVEPGGVLKLRNLQLKSGISNDLKGGGAILLRHDSTLIAEDVLFKDNQVTNGDGGAILGDDATMFLHRCTFSLNRASMGDGGAIAASQGYVQITNSTFVENTAFFSGGALRTSRSSLILFNVEMTDNIARSGGGLAMSEMTQGSVHSTKFIRNDAAYGGAVYTSNGKVSLISCTFIGNSAWDPSSEGVYVQRDSSIVTGTVYMIHSTIQDHDASKFINTVPFSSGPLYQIRVTPLADCMWRDGKLPITLPLCGLCQVTNLLPEPHRALNCDCTEPGELIVPLTTTPINETVALSVFFPAICFRFAIESLFPITCITSGGYVEDGITCILPTSTSNQRYLGCHPVAADIPSVKESNLPPDGNAGGDYWCPIVAKYSISDETKRLWGYCGMECGYAMLDGDVSSEVPSQSPTRPDSVVPSSAPTFSWDNEYEYETNITIRPSMVSAAYAGGYGSYIEVQFDCMTDCGGNCDLPLPCYYYFQESNEDWTCKWTSPNKLAVFVTNAVFQLSIIHTNKILCINTGERSGYARGSIDLTGFQSLPAPSVVLVAPSVMSLCATKDLVLDGAGSKVLSAGGIAWLNWELRWTEPRLDFFSPELEALKSKLEACSQTKRLYCATEMLPHEARYAFALTIANAFGKTATASVIVEAEVDSSPVVIQFAAGNLVLARYTGTSTIWTNLEASVKLKSVCTTDETEEMDEVYAAPLRVLWNVIAPKDIAQSSYAASAIIPTADPFVVQFAPERLRLSPSQELPYDVTVRLTAYLDLQQPSAMDPRSWTYSDLVVRIVATPVVLDILNANRTLSNTETSLTVVGQITSGARFAQEQFEYQWSCQVTDLNTPTTQVVQRPCPGVSLSVVNLTQPQTSTIDINETLPHSMYVFTLTAIGTSTYRTASVSAFFRTLNFTEDNAPTPPSESSPRVVVLTQSRQQNSQQGPSSGQDSANQANTPRLNRDRAIRVRGSCPQEDANLIWKLIENGFKRDHSHLLRPLPSAVVTPAGTLGEGKYTLSLACGDPSSQGRVLFDVNNEPRGGSVIVTPTLGTVFATVFVMRALNWVDDEGDLPLRYSFELGLANDRYRKLAPLSTWSSWETRLPLETVAVRASAVDALGAASAFVETSVMVSPPLATSQYSEWFSLACRRWRRDWAYTQRSGVEVLSEIGVSVRTLRALPVDAPFIQVLALGMTRVALKSIGNIISDSDLSEDARADIFSYVVRELVMYLPGQQAADELLSGLMDWEATRLTVRGARSVFDASLFPLLMLSPSAQTFRTDELIDCSYLKKIKTRFDVSSTIGGNDTAILRTEILLLGTDVLGCNKTEWNVDSTLGRLRRLRRRLEGQGQGAKSLLTATSSNSIGDLLFIKSGNGGSSKNSISKLGQDNNGNASSSTPSVEMDDVNSTSPSESTFIFTQKIVHVLQTIANASLVDALAGEDPVILNSDLPGLSSTFQAWKLARSKGVWRKFELDDVAKTVIELEGPLDAEEDEDNAWIVAMNYTSPSTDSTSLANSALILGGNPWSRWGRIRVRNMQLNLHSMLSGNVTNATLNRLEDGRISIEITRTEWVHVNRTHRPTSSPTSHPSLGPEDAWENSTEVVEEPRGRNSTRNTTMFVEMATAVSLDIECVQQTVPSLLTNNATNNNSNSMTIPQGHLCQVIEVDFISLSNVSFDCVCSREATDRRLLQEGEQHSIAGYTLGLFATNIQTSSSIIGGIPIDDDYGPSPPTFLGETFTPTQSPQSNTLTIIPSQQSQAWVAILTILCVCLASLILGIGGIYLDRKEEAQIRRAQRVAVLMDRMYERRLARKFFTKMRWAITNNAFLVESDLVGLNLPSRKPTLNQSLLVAATRDPALGKTIKNEYLWKGFVKRHAWLAHFLGPISPVWSPRLLRVILLFAISTGNMGFCSVFLLAGWTNVFVIALVSSAIVAITTWYVDRIGRNLLSRMMKRASAKSAAAAKTGDNNNPSFISGGGEEKKKSEASSSLTEPQTSPSPSFPTLGNLNASNLSNSPAKLTHRVKTPRPFEPQVIEFGESMRRSVSTVNSRQIDGLQQHQPHLDDELMLEDIEVASDNSWNDNRITFINKQDNFFVSFAAPQHQHQSRAPGHSVLTHKSTASDQHTPPDGWSSWHSRDSQPALNTLRSVSSVHKPLHLGKEELTGESLKLEKQLAIVSFRKHAPSRWALVCSRLPLAVVGWAMAAFAVTFNASSAGADRFYPWIESWSLSLVLDVLVMQVGLAVLRLVASVLIRRNRSRRLLGMERKQEPQPNHGGLAGPGAFRWQARAQTTSDLLNEEELMLMDAIIDAASVDTDTEARELLELILGVNHNDEGGVTENEHLAMRRRDSTSDIGIGHFNVVAAGPGGSSNDDDRSLPHPHHQHHQSNPLFNHTADPSGTSLASTNDSPRGGGGPQAATIGRGSLVTTSSGGGTVQGQMISPVSQNERITDEMIV